MQENQLQPLYKHSPHSAQHKVAIALCDIDLHFTWLALVARLIPHLMPWYAVVAAAVGVAGMALGDNGFHFT